MEQVHKTYHVEGNDLVGKRIFRKCVSLSLRCFTDCHAITQDSGRWNITLTAVQEVWPLKVKFSIGWWYKLSVIVTLSLLKLKYQEFYTRPNFNDTSQMQLNFRLVSCLTQVPRLWIRTLVLIEWKKSGIDQQSSRFIHLGDWTIVFVTLFSFTVCNSLRLNQANQKF